MEICVDVCTILDLQIAALAAFSIISASVHWLVIGIFVVIMLLVFGIVGLMLFVVSVGNNGSSTYCCC